MNMKEKKNLTKTNRHTRLGTSMSTDMWDGHVKDARHRRHQRCRPEAATYSYLTDSSSREGIFPRCFLSACT